MAQGPGHNVFVLSLIHIFARVLGLTLDDFDDVSREPEKPVPTYDDVELLIARNGKKMSKEQKLRLIQLLSEIDE